jgi:2-polyprenyl-6-methoxyphenol hydroxylase-like FAD-dependent oxidoreductase
MDTSSAPDTAVLVVGGGPTGLLLTCALRRRGVECVLVDAYDEPLGWDRATVIHPRSLQIFESIGIVDEFTTTGVHIRGCRIHADGTVLAEMDYHENRTRYPFDIGLSEDRTEQILTRYLEGAGGRVVRSTRLVDLDQRADRVVATLETHGEQRALSASWVVGCDGYRSTVRDLSGIAYEGDVPDEPWAVFDAGLAGWGSEWDLVQAFFDDPLVIITPLPGRRFRVYSRPQSRETDLEADARAVLDRYSPGVTFTDVHNPTRFLCHARLAERFRSGRVLLAGDAAHACSPTEGHGMNTGLQDAYNLGWKLAHVCRGEAGEVLLDSYDAERRPVAQRIVETGAAADAAQARLDQLERAARNARVAATFSDPDAVQLEAASGAEVDRYYDRSAVVSGVPQPGLAGPAAGRLLPLTAAVRARDGSEAALHDFARRLGHTLFVLGGAATSAADVAAVLDRLESVPGGEFVGGAYGFAVGDGHGPGDPRVGTMSEETAAQLGVDGVTVLVIRPDRFIGMRRDGADTAGTAYLTDYLSTLAA